MAAANPNEFFLELVSVTGAAAAYLLIEHFGGVEVYIPRYPNPEHTLTKAIGLEAAVAFEKHLGHGRIVVPLCHCNTASVRRVEIARMMREGRSKRQIAQHLRLHIRTVEKAIARLREDGA